MMPRDYEDHPEWDYIDIDCDDYNTSLYTALDALDAADDYNGDYEHSLDYPDINGMESSLTDEEEGDDRKNSDSSSSGASGVSGATSAAANAVSAIVRSFVMLATGAAIITGSYQKSLAIRNGEAANMRGSNESMESSDDGYTDGDNNSESGAEGENAEETVHSFRLSNTSEKNNGKIIYTYVCDSCGKEITVEVNVESRKLESEGLQEEEQEKLQMQEENGVENDK